MEENQQGELSRHSKTYKFTMEKHSLGNSPIQFLRGFFMHGKLQRKKQLIRRTTAGGSSICLQETVCLLKGLLLNHTHCMNTFLLHRAETKTSSIKYQN